MSTDQNGGFPLPENSKTKIGSPLYPSLEDSQPHANTSVTLGSPTVPHPIFEGVSHPMSPIPSDSYRSTILPLPMRTRDIPQMYHNPTNTSDIYQFDIASNDQGATPDQPRIDTSGIAYQRKRWTISEIFCSRICWLVSVFFILSANALVLGFYLFI